MTGPARTAPTELDDASALSRWTTGDRAAGAALIARHVDELRGYFRKRARGEHDDLVQDTLLACLEAAPRFRAEATFRSYLFGIARNLLFTHYRAARRASALEFAPELCTVARDPSPAQRLAAIEQSRALRGALDRLPVEQQVALALVYFGGFDGPSLARALRVPLDTAYSRVRRAKERLRGLGFDADVEVPLAAGCDLEGWAEHVRRTHLRRDQPLLAGTSLAPSKKSTGARDGLNRSAHTVRVAVPVDPPPPCRTS